jgi:polysaccharide export outer membrane protein
MIISGDKLQITVLGQPAMTGEWVVDGSGIVAIPGLRSIQTSGLTARDLEKKISQALAAKGLAAAVNVKNLTVQQLTYDSFFVRGEVVAPGQFPFVEGMTILSAVAKAGGFTNRANIHQFTILRRIGGKVIEGSAQSNTPIRPGDVITVLKRVGYGGAVNDVEAHYPWCIRASGYGTSRTFLCLNGSSVVEG